MLGRGRELQAAEDCLDRTFAGRGLVMTIAGDPGIGKSVFAQSLADRAAARGAQITWGRCNEAPGAPPYAPWLQLLDRWSEGCDDAALRSAGAA
jgi:predicted ATPase